MTENSPTPTSATVLSISGQLGCSDFPQFAAHFASRLNLSGYFLYQSDDRLEILLSGPAELIDMFEIACWLGPIGARVDTIDCRTETSKRLLARRFTGQV